MHLPDHYELFRCVLRVVANLTNSITVQYFGQCQLSDNFVNYEGTYFNNVTQKSIFSFQITNLSQNVCLFNKHLIYQYARYDCKLWNNL